MRIIQLTIAALAISLLFTNCKKDEDSSTTGLSDNEIVNGLKAALKVGTDTATKVLSATNGYYKDQAVKLLLPEEVNKSLANFKSKSINVLGLGTVTGEKIYTSGIPGFVKPLSAKEDSIILGINRAAEAAAKDAGPIFFDAITNMSINDGKNILLGGVDTAATAYLNSNTRVQLFSKFEPKIDQALKTVKVGNKPVVTSYEDFVADYNNVLTTKVPTLTGSKSLASLMGINTIKADNLSQYSTNKGLDGLFIKVQDEERKIRKNPLHRVSDILKKVFSQLD